MSKASAASRSRQERKITYEKERRERLSQLFKDLYDSLAASGWPPERIETQVECLSIAIAIIKRTPYDPSFDKDETGDALQDGIPELPDADSVSSPKEESPRVTRTRSSATSSSGHTATTSTARSNGSGSRRGSFDDGSDASSSASKLKGSGTKRRRQSDDMDTEEAPPRPSKSPKGSFNGPEPTFSDVATAPRGHSHSAPSVVKSSYQTYSDHQSSTLASTSSASPHSSLDFSQQFQRMFAPPRPTSSYGERFETPLYPSASPLMAIDPSPRPYGYPSVPAQSSYFDELRFLQSVQISAPDDEPFTDHYGL